MKFGTCIAVLAAVVFGGGCFAATKSSVSPKWQQEPSAFMGVKLEGNLKYELKQCPAGYDLPTELCWKSTSEEFYEVWGLPKVGIDNLRMSVKVVDSNIQYIRLTTYDDQFPKLRDLLVQKYGNPSSTRKEIVKTAAGATFDNEKLYWQGVNITMVLSRYSGDIETSSLVIFNEKAAAEALTKSQKGIKEAASKL